MYKQYYRKKCALVTFRLRSLRERVALLALEQEDSSIHAHGAPFDRLGDLALSLLHVHAVPAELDEVKAVVKDGFVFESVVNLLAEISRVN